MNKKLVHKAAQLEEMLLTFDDAIKLYGQEIVQPTREDCDLVPVLRLSVIKQFRGCYSDFWSFIKAHVKVLPGAPCASSPKFIAQAARQQNILSRPEAKRAASLVVTYRKSAAAYENEVADEIAQNAPQALTLMKTVLERLQKNIQSQP